MFRQVLTPIIWRRTRSKFQELTSPRKLSVLLSFVLDSILTDHFNRLRTKSVRKEFHEHWLQKEDILKLHFSQKSRLFFGSKTLWQSKVDLFCNTAKVLRIDQGLIKYLQTFVMFATELCILIICSTILKSFFFNMIQNPSNLWRYCKNIKSG